MLMVRIVLSVFMAGMTVCDLVWYRIPNPVIASAAAIAACSRLLEGGTGVLPSCLGGMAVPFAVCLPLFAFSMLGAGDIKLLMTAGIYAGPGGILVVMLHALFLAGAVALCKVVFLHMGTFRAFYFLDYLQETGSCLFTASDRDTKAGPDKDPGTASEDLTGEDQAGIFNRGKGTLRIRPYIQTADIRARRPWLMHLSLPITAAFLLHVWAGL